jgi:hypothetical protein
MLLLLPCRGYATYALEDFWENGSLAALLFVTALKAREKPGVMWHTTARAG